MLTDTEIAELAREMVFTQENAKAVWRANGRRGASQEAADLVNRAGDAANRAYAALKDAVMPKETQHHERD